ncbi:MAG: CHRD domain-containing protein [Phycisphaerales bacterium]
MKISTTGAFSALALAASANAGILSANFMLTGDQQPTPTGTSAIGIGTVDYDTTDDTFDISLYVVGIPLGNLMGAGPNSTPVHIHLAPAGSNGGIVIDLGFLGSFAQSGLGIELNLTDVAAGGTFGAINSDPDVVQQAFVDGNLYVNIHTSTFPGGEIRGQIPPIPIPTPATAALIGAAGLLAVGRRRG